MDGNDLFDRGKAGCEARRSSTHPTELCNLGGRRDRRILLIRCRTEKEIPETDFVSFFWPAHRTGSREPRAVFVCAVVLWPLSLSHHHLTFFKRRWLGEEEED